jgi:hypothetical protein
MQYMYTPAICQIAGCVRAVVVSLASKLDAAQSQLSTTQRSLTSTEDSLKLRMMELEGANAQLQVLCIVHLLREVCRDVVLVGLHAWQARHLQCSDG